MIGATFYVVPQTLSIESNSQDYMADLVSFFGSTKNKALARPIFIVSLIGFAGTAVAVFWHVVVATGAGQPAPEVATR